MLHTRMLKLCPYNKTHDEDESTVGCSHMHKSGLVQLLVYTKTSAHDVKGMEVKSGTWSFCVRSYSACEKSERQAWAEKWRWRWWRR